MFLGGGGCLQLSNFRLYILVCFEVAKNLTTAFSDIILDISMLYYNYGHLVGSAPI